MKLLGLAPGVLIERENRFLARVLLDGREVRAHVPNPGRMQEMFVPGVTVWLKAAGHPRRKTAYDLVLVQHAGTLVSADTRLPNALVAEAITRGEIMPGPWQEVRREVSLGHSRIDILLEASERRRWVEVKSVTLVENGRALFPDAPTLRGARHLIELAQAIDSGDEATAAFVVQRDDACSFAPHVEMDPALGRALYMAIQAGVAIEVYTCRVTTEELAITGQIELETDWIRHI